MDKRTKIKTIELFAGVGGFRVGLDRASMYNGTKFDMVWSNQWEPSTRIQHASDVYMARFSSDGHTCEDISNIMTKDIPDHDLLTAGFPCQDYSVARTLNQAAGLKGKKGVLWWQIHRIIEEKSSKAPKYLMLENVDRLLKSPVKQRGRDFAIMLASLADLGYIVEWRVINAADYGMPQRRRRIFIIGYHRSTKIAKHIMSLKDPAEWIVQNGVIAEAFPVTLDNELDRNEFKIHGDLAEISERPVLNGTKGSPFQNSGIMIDRHVWTIKLTPRFNGKRRVLGDILLPEKDVPAEFFIKEEDLPRWHYLKGSKKEIRRSSEGFEYHYSEGPMSFPDALDKPARTVITAEGGSSPSRFKHVVLTPSGKHRRLTPVELERLFMFPDDHTAGKPTTKRAFFMGNSLVVGVVEKLGIELAARIKNSKQKGRQAG